MDRLAAALLELVRCDSCRARYDERDLDIGPPGGVAAMRCWRCGTPRTVALLFAQASPEDGLDPVTALGRAVRALTCPHPRCGAALDRAQLIDGFTHADRGWMYVRCQACGEVALAVDAAARPGPIGIDEATDLCFAIHARRLGEIIGRP